MTGPATPLAAPRHSLDQTTIDPATLTALCSVCGPTTIVRNGENIKRDGTLVPKYRCSHYYRDRYRRLKGKAPAPAPARGRPRKNEVDPTVAGNVLPPAVVLRLRDQWVVESEGRCWLCGIPHAPHNLGAMVIPGKILIRGAYCMDCRSLISLSRGNVALVLKLAQRLRDHETGEHLELGDSATVPDYAHE